MIVNKYLFNEFNIPNPNKDKINMMNRELIERLTYVAKNMYAQDADLNMFDDICGMIAEEIFCKYSGRDIFQ